MKRLHDRVIEEVFHLYIRSQRRLLRRINDIQGRSGEMFLKTRMYVQLNTLSRWETD
jgi:hypothetical protein